MKPTTHAGLQYRLGDTVDGVAARALSRHQDQRGWLIELFRCDEVAPEILPVMAYLSQTEPGVARGPHEHLEQTDYFAFVGPGDFQIWIWDPRPDSPTRGVRMLLRVGESNPHSVIIPPRVVHAYRNISAYPGWVFNAPNRLYAGQGKSGPVDEIRHEDDPASPFALES